MKLRIVAWFMIVLGAIYVISVPRLLYLATTPEIAQGDDAEDAIMGLRIGAVSCAVLAVPTLLGGIKLLQRRRWAYWLVVADLALCVLGLALGTFEDFSIEWTVFWFLLVFVLVFAIALLPSTRRELSTSGL
jgi:hypothetical protein